MRRPYVYAIMGAVSAMMFAASMSRAASPHDEFAGAWSPVHARQVLHRPGTASNVRIVSNFFWKDVYVSAIGEAPGGSSTVVQKLPVAGAAADLAVSDFNSDGIQDFAVADFLESSIEVYFGETDGTYRHRSSIPVGRAPVALSVRDYNSDGMPDIASASYCDRTVSRAIAVGGGRFAQPAQSPVDASLADMPLFTSARSAGVDHTELRNAVRIAALEAGTRRLLAGHVTSSDAAYSRGDSRVAVSNLISFVEQLRSASDTGLADSTRDSLKLLAIDTIEEILAGKRASVDLTVTPPRIRSGESARLHWRSTGAVAASIDNGVGSVRVNGARTVSPSTTTIYTITVWGADGMVAVDSVRVKVTGGAGAIHVDVNRGDDSAGTGSLRKPYKTITKGLSMAAAGNVVSVAAGYYAASTGETFPLIIPAGVTVQGSGGDKTTVYGGGTFHSTSQDLDRNVMFVPGNNATVSMIGIVGGVEFGIWIEDAAVRVNACRTLAAGVDAIKLVGASTLELRNTVLEASLLNGVSATDQSALDIDGNVFRWGWFGVEIGGSGSSTINAASFHNNSAWDVSTGTGAITLTGNTFNATPGSALASYSVLVGGSSSDVSITGNSITGDYLFGITLSTGTGGYVAANSISGCGTGMYVLLCPATFRNNTVSGCTTAGATCYESAADFGTAGSPGGNTFHNLATGAAANLRNHKITTGQVVNAVGNSWDGPPSADFSGTYPGGHDIEGAAGAGVVY